MRNRKLIRINLFLLLTAVMLLGTSCGKNKAATMKLIKTDGEVGVDNEKGKAVDLIENLGLYNGYGVNTQKKSFAWIDLDDTKLTKMDEKSDVDIKKDGKKLELVVNSGSLFFNVTKPLEDNESMDIRTSTTICGIRGTCGWVESHGDTSYVGLLDGKVECSVAADGKEETVTVNAREFLIVKKDGDHVTYEVKKLTYRDVPEFVQAEITDEPFALEKESYTVDDFLGVYYNTDELGVKLGLDDKGALYFTASGNGIYQSYSSYEIDGNIIRATYQNTVYTDVNLNTYDTYTYTDTFTLNEDGGLTIQYGAEGMYPPGMNNFALKKERTEIDRFLGAYSRERYYGLELFTPFSDPGSLSCWVGNTSDESATHSYTNYSIAGNELKADREAGGQTDTFILNDDGTITATFADGNNNGTYAVDDGSVFFDGVHLH